MLLSKLAHRAVARQPAHILPGGGSLRPVPQAHTFQPLVRRFQQLRCYAQSAPKGSRPLHEELQRQARAAAKAGQSSDIPERVIIYHAGTGRTTFLAMIKVTTLFLGAFFGFIIVPGYIKAEKSPLEIAGVAVAGLVPFLFVTFTTSPFVTHIHIHLPPAARASRTILERFVRAMPPTTALSLTTMSAIGKPRYSILRAVDLVPATSGRRRFGLVNYVRDAATENAARRWYMFPAVTKFFVQEQPATPKPRYQKKPKAVVDTWIWDAIKEKIHKRNAATSKRLDEDYISATFGMIRLAARPFTTRYKVLHGPLAALVACRRYYIEPESVLGAIVSARTVNDTAARCIVQDPSEEKILGTTRASGINDTKVLRMARDGQWKQTLQAFLQKHELHTSITLQALVGDLDCVTWSAIALKRNPILIHFDKFSLSRT
ncbi:hypothetical protein HJFPF1_04747 [Paramyrothecium foliicola]|nr:hypothetical protein HJFPF1_04747 [Paramyrothecium foliicola]